MSYQFKSKPLDKLNVTQPFGVDYIGGGFYQKLGMKGHNGIDFSAVDNKVYAVDDGEFQYFPDNGSPNGNWCRLWVKQPNHILEVVYGHLKSQVWTEKTVTAGETLAISDNTGLTTGPHLHFGVRFWDLSQMLVPDYNNGFFGYFDPKPYFDPDWFLTPVAKRYGQAVSASRNLAFAGGYAYFFKTQKRTPTSDEFNALVYGYWDLRTVLDPAMYPVWTQYSKPEAKAKGIIK